jgi:hypothetical protein
MAIRGALIEYSGQFLGPLPNIVVFQFNPEQMSRTIEIAHSGGAGADLDRAQRAQTERAAAASPPTETFNIKIELSAAEDLGTPGPFESVTRMFGVGPQIAALEKMVYPAGGGLLAAAIDAIGDALAGGGAGQAEKSIPPELLPKLLFIWGPSRVLPVKITSMRVAEQEYDHLLNPTKAEVDLGLEVANVPGKDDLIAIGALTYTRTVKDVQVVTSMARGIASLPSIIPF